MSLKYSSSVAPIIFLTRVRNKWRPKRRLWFVAPAYPSHRAYDLSCGASRHPHDQTRNVIVHHLPCSPPPWFALDPTLLRRTLYCDANNIIYVAFCAEGTPTFSSVSPQATRIDRALQDFFNTWVHTIVRNDSKLLLLRNVRNDPN